MARFNMELPTEIIKDFEKIHGNTEKIFGEMTRAGAEVVATNVRANAPSGLANYVKLSKTYRTPSDGGINTKVYFSGYMPFRDGRTTFSRKGGSGKTYTTNKGVPADFVAMVFEYGRSGYPFPKKPFFRKSFRGGQIEAAMLKAQKEASGGLLDE